MITTNKNDSFFKTFLVDYCSIVGQYILMFSITWSSFVNPKKENDSIFFKYKIDVK